MTTHNTFWLRSATPFIWTALAAVACVTGALLFADKPLYEAHAVVELEPTADQLQLFSSDSMILKATRQAGLHVDSNFKYSPSNAGLISSVRQHLLLRRDGPSQLVHVTFTASDAEKASAFVNALIDAYTDEIQSRGLAKAASVSEGLDALQALIEESETRLADAASTLTNAESIALIRETNRQRQLYAVMLQQASVPATVSRLVDRAEVPLEPIESASWSGLAWGILMALCGAVLFFISRKRLKDVPQSAVHADVMSAAETTDQPVVAISNAGTGYTNPSTLLDYVENLLTTNRSVLIIDCERGGALTESVGLRGELGFSDFLMDHSALEGSVPVWKTNRRGVSVMPAGSQPFRIPALISRPNVRKALAVLLAEYDRVVINAPGILTNGEMRDLSPLVDGVVLVAPRERSIHLTPFAARQVEEFGGRVLGLVEDPDQLVIAA